MEFEYFTFPVESYLERKQHPSFAFKAIKPQHEYYVLKDPATSDFSLTKAPSDSVIVPVFAVTTAMNNEDNPNKPSHGSSLFLMGMEHALIHFSELLKIRRGPDVSKTIITLATNCHAMSEKQYRAYYGLVFEVEGFK